MKILEILGQSKDQLEEAALGRKAKALKRNQEKLVDKLEEKRDDLEAKKSNLLAVNSKTVNEETWNTEFQDVQVELATIGEEIRIAKQTMDEYFTESVTPKTSSRTK